MTNEEILLLVKMREDIVERTRSGPVNEWLERMRQLADICGLDVAKIEISMTPLNYAHSIVKYAITRGKGEELRKLLGL